MDYQNWGVRDLEELDAKLDALTEHLGLEFVFEKISDGSDAADRERVYVRSKAKYFKVEPNIFKDVRFDIKRFDDVVAPKKKSKSKKRP